MSETLLDVKGMNCPLPVLRANRALRGLPPGERLRVLATDRAAVADFQAFCRETGHALLAWSEEAGVFSFVIRRRPESPRQPTRIARRRRMTVALFTHPACLDHDAGRWHPECPDRLRAVLRALEHPDFVPLLREAGARRPPSSSSPAPIRPTMSRRSWRSAPPRASWSRSTPTPR